ncbi:MAG: hypothetical protein KAG64_01510 [Bacteroidales bacterium]|nr:hypothetical protein [Bacteroidales bacterium]
MIRITLIIVGVFLLNSIYAQSETRKRFPFKKATITYKITGDYQGTRTIYIDDFGEKIADYWKGSYEKRQPGPNERVDFEFHDISIGKLKYQINDLEYNAIVSINPNYFYVKEGDHTQTSNEEVLKVALFKKTDRVEDIEGELCTVWHQRIRFMIEVDNYIWINDNNIVRKYTFGFLTQLQVMGSIGVATIEKINFEAEIPGTVFSDIPSFFIYNYMNTNDPDGNSFDDQVFGSDAEMESFKKELEQKGFVENRDIQVEDFNKVMQEFSNQYIKEKVSASYGSGSIGCHFAITQQTDSTNAVFVSFDIRTRQNLDKQYIDSFKRSFNHFTTIEYNKIEIDEKKAFYLYGLTNDDEEDIPKSVIVLNNKDKYSIKFIAYGKYSQEEMVKMLKKSKILDL